jgi:hypothetical protein
MIQIKHFKEVRGEKTPDWPTAKEFLKSLNKSQILGISAYPTGADHNLIVVYDDWAEEPKPEQPKA